ncbi:unnamed protein product [Adineta steineri]|uniref:Multiple PDZ domain protein n=1 Tax=Adineta steineri TaxID=433720 RepID=A0A814W884_9BILA|nr:unnamed protein product [Adineta steineri]
MAQLCEASTILKRLSERLYQYSNCQQPDIDSLQQIIDSPLFNTLYNLQESFQQLKVEFEKGNPSIKNCSFDFDLEGHLKFISKKITNQNIKNNKRLANDNIVRKIILTKQTPDESLGFSIIEKKHRLFDINAIFIEGIQSNGIAELNGQLQIGDQIVCINDIYLNSKDTTLAFRAHQLLNDSTRLSIELVVISTTFDYPHAAVSTSNNDGHSCVPTLSTPFHVDMVLNTLWTQIEVVELTNDGSGLGFGITGNKSTGVVVKAIVPGSTVDKDGRIRTGDHIFQINHICVRGMSSEQVASILRQSSQQVRLVVARSIREPTSIDTTMNTPPLVSQRASLTSETLIRPTNNVDLSFTGSSVPIINDNDTTLNSSQNKILLRTERLLESNHSFEKILENLHEQCQNEDGTEILDVTLEKGDDGLGITVAGYVSPDSTNNDAIAGIFIRDITENSVCARDARLAIGDQIVEVNDQSLSGFSNVQALYLLQNTSSSVRLKVRRHLDGTKYEKIKEMIALESAHQIDEKLKFQSQLDINEQMHQKWIKFLGNAYEILIADVYKPDNGGLGITLEGTVDIENGEEVRPHHYIRALLRDGPIGTEGTLKSGDELLEVNNQILYGKNHIHVIGILKRVKHQIKLVCARRKISEKTETTILTNNHNRSRSISFGKTAEIVVKAKSMGTLDGTDGSINLLSSIKRPIKYIKSRSLEVISNLALWSTSTMDVELNKGDNGLGFSVLDYQDPSNPSDSPVIVIRSLVPGGITQLDGRIVPGDRLVAVNDITLENMTLDDVIKILKSTAKGPVKLSVSKPLPYPKFKNDNDDKIVTDSDQDINNNQINERSSRLSKSKTSTEIVTNHKRSASSHRPSRSSSIKQAAVSAGIALSAPAILSKHEYMESLLNQENMRKKTEQRASSANRTYNRDKIFTKYSSLDKTAILKDKVRQLNLEEYLDLLPRKKSHTITTTQQLSTKITLNLPEFLCFQSDHIVLIPQIASYPSYDRLRGPSAFSTTKFNRQSANNNNINSQTTATTANLSGGGSPRSSYTSAKRLSRSRQIQETNNNNNNNNHDHQQQQTHISRPTSLRQTMNILDSKGCFHEPDLSSDDNHHSNNNNNNNYNIVLSSSSSSPLAHQHAINNVICPLTTSTTATTIVDEDANEVDTIIKQHELTLTNGNNNDDEKSNIITPRIKTPTTPIITSKWTSSRQSSRMASPALSTSSQSSGRIITFLNHEVIQLPVYLEREIRVKQNFDQLGLVVDAYVDEGVNGCYVRSITPTSTTTNQHGIRPGDYVLSINNESMKKISNAQARSIIRRASLMGSDICVIFIPGDEAKQFKDHTLDPHSTGSPIPPEIADLDDEQTLTKPISTTDEVVDSDIFDSNTNQQTYPTVIDSETLSATLWGPARTVILYRSEHVKSLGISIVGGKLDFSGPGNTIESCISGIFIKHVLPDSPAGRNGTLKTGDRILEVNGNDLRDASHDRAVDIIRAAQSPVHFTVQSLLDPSNPSSSTPDLPSIDYSNIPLIQSPSQNKISSINKHSPINERKTEDELIKQFGHLNGDLFYFDIKRSLSEINEPLGLSLIGHRDPNKLAVFVCDIQPNSLLDRDNRIHPGDQLLEVNGEILLGKAHSTVTPIIRSIKADTLNFVVLRNPNSINDMALNNQHAATARLRALAMTSNDAHLTSTSSKTERSQLTSSSIQHPSEQQMINDASHFHQRIHIPRHQPDVNEHKENDDRLTSTSVFPPPTHTFDETEYIPNKNEKKCSIPQITPITIDKKCSVADDLPTSSSSPLSPNRIITKPDVQTDNNEVSSFNHNICTHSTITEFHSNSSDVTSPICRFIPASSSSFDQQSCAYENNESSPTLPSLITTTTTTPPPLLVHEQANHANDKYLENKNQTNNDSLTNSTQISSSPKHNSIQQNKDETSPTHSSKITQSNDQEKLIDTILPSDDIVSSPTKEKSEENSSDTLTNPVTTITNGTLTARISNMSSSSSSSSSLSVSTPSSSEHATKKQSLLPVIQQVVRRTSMSTPGPPITLILNKDQKGSFGLTLSQHDNEVWIQSVQPHGPADQQDIRAGDHLIQINGTSVEALKFTDVQNMLEHANSNQIHLTCIPYREPQAQPVVININQAESLPLLNTNDNENNKEDDPRTRSVLVGQETLIEIDRGQSGLGLSVVGGSDTQLTAIIIHDIYDGCAAQRDARLLVGDQILEVNSIDLRSATHEEAIQALRQASTVVRILVLRGKMLTEMMNEQDKFDVITIELIKKSGKGLGFSIIGRRHGFGVFISHILEGGCAEKDGRLMSGDLILEVNGQDLRNAAYEHVAYTLKTLPHGKVNIKIGRLKASSQSQNRPNSVGTDRKNRSRSSSSNFRRSSANKINDR